MSKYKTPILGMHSSSSSDKISYRELNDNFTTLDSFAGITNSKLSEVTDELKERGINVMNFGAQGNGITDDTISIQNAIDYCISNGYKLIFPSGKYMISATLNIHGLLQMEGTSTSKSHLTQDYTSGTYFIKTNDFIGIKVLSNYCYFKNFAVIGCESDRSHGIMLGDVINGQERLAGEVYLLNIFCAFNGGDGVWAAVGNCSNLDIYCSWNAGNGLRLESHEELDYGEVNEFTVRLNATGNGEYGLYINRSYTNKILDAVLQGNGKAGIYLNSPHNIIQCYTEDNGPINNKIGIIGGDSAFYCELKGKINENFISMANPTNMCYLMYNNSRPAGLSLFSTHVITRYTTTATNFKTSSATTLQKGEYVNFTINQVYYAEKGGSVICTPIEPLPNGLVFYAWIAANDTVQIKVTNVWDDSITLPIHFEFKVVVILDQLMQ